MKRKEKNAPAINRGIFFAKLSGRPMTSVPLDETMGTRIGEELNEPRASS